MTTMSRIAMAFVLTLSPLPGVSAPTDLKVSQPGVARRSCGNAGGPATDFEFRLLEPPAMTSTDAAPDGPRVLRVRVNVSSTELGNLRRWKIQNPDGHGGLLASICSPGGHPCAHATSGSVLFTRAAGSAFDGEWQITFDSGHRVEGGFAAWLPDDKGRELSCR